jgi:hypothetical protein
MTEADAFREQAQLVAAGQLRKARGLLKTVAPEERVAIEEVAYAVAEGLADRLLAEAKRNELVAVALGEDRPKRTAPAAPSLLQGYS